MVKTLLICTIENRWWGIFLVFTLYGFARDYKSFVRQLAKDVRDILDNLLSHGYGKRNKTTTLTV